MIHGFCEIPGAISWAWQLSAPQSEAELGKTPSPSRGLLRWRVQSCRKHQNHTDLQQLEIQPWILNQLFSVHTRSGSHSVAAMGNICARHRDTHCHRAAAPSDPIGHEPAAVHSLHISLYCPLIAGARDVQNGQRCYSWNRFLNILVLTKHKHL